MSVERPTLDDAPGGAMDAAVDALLDDLAPLLSDPDVSEVLATGGALRVLRRGTREMLTARVSAAAMECLKAAAPDYGVVSRVRRGHVVHIGAAAETLRIEAPAQARDLAALVDSGVMEPAAAEALEVAVRRGESHIVQGAHRIGRRDVARALGLLAAASYQTFCAADETDVLHHGALVTPTDARGADDVDAAVRLGAEFVYLGENDLAQVRAWLARGVRVVAALGAIAPDDDLPVTWCRVGARPSGAPCLLHPPVAPAMPAAPRPAPVAVRPSAPAVMTSTPPMLPAAGAPPAGDAPSDLPPLAPLPSGPPAGWATDDDEHAPGWELSSPPGLAPVDDDEAFAGGDAFRRVMDDVQTRPAYTPQPPPAHPQTARLQQHPQHEEADAEAPDPFGGLTLEPPRTGPGEVE